MLLHHEITGRGPAVLLTHGFAASSAMFASTVEALAGDHTTIAWDMRGHGRSAAPDDPAAYSAAASLDDMATLLLDAGVDRATLVGHSLGGYLSLELALARPDLVAGLVLVDTGPGFRRDDARAGWNAMAERYAEGLAAQGIAGLPGGAELAPPEHGVAGLIHTARATLRQSDGHVIDGLASIAVPTLVLVGARDEAFVPGSTYMAGKIPGATLAVVDDAGHAPTVTHPGPTNAAIATFLADHGL